MKNYLRKGAVQLAGCTAVLAMATGVPALAASPSGNYVGAQVTRLTYDDSALSSDLNPTAVVARIGHSFTPNFALEARVGTGISGGSITANGARLNFKLDSLIGAYGIGRLPVSDQVAVYALAGYSRIGATADATYYGAYGSNSDHDSGFSYGAGVEFTLRPNVGVGVEYASYLDKSDYQLTALSVGLNVHFR